MAETWRARRCEPTPTGLREILTLVLSLVMVLSATAGCSSTDTGSDRTVTSPTPVVSSPSASSPAAATSSTTAASSLGSAVTLEVDNRPFALHLPPKVPEKAALIVALHGYTGSASDGLTYFRLRKLAAEQGMLLATPQGTTDREGKPFWNASRACCNLFGADVDDSTYLSKVIDAVLAKYPVDPGRVYIVGHSNGGFMALRMACDHADQVAAVVSVSGAMDVNNDCDPSEPVSVLQVHGSADDTIGFGGGEIMGNPFTSAARTVGLWRDQNRCDEAAVAGKRLDVDALIEGDETTTTQWTCDDDTNVALWQIDGGSHVPGLTEEFGAALIEWLDQHQRR